MIIQVKPRAASVARSYSYNAPNNIQVKPRDAGGARSYSYNAPNNIRVGDLVELPGNSGIGAHTWVGEVTAVGSRAARLLSDSGYHGPIKAIVGRAPLKVTVEADTRSALRQKLIDALEDLDDLDLADNIYGSER